MTPSLWYKPTRLGAFVEFAILNVTEAAMLRDSRNILTPRIDSGEQTLTVIAPLAERRTVEVLVASAGAANMLVSRLAACYTVQITVPAGPAMPVQLSIAGAVAGVVRAYPASTGAHVWAVLFDVQSEAS